MQSTSGVTEARGAPRRPEPARGGGVARRYTAPLVQPGSPLNFPAAERGFVSRAPPPTPHLTPMPKDVILTAQGLETLQRELDDLQTTKRREVAERIKEAREFGGVSGTSTTTPRTSR